MSEHHSVSPGMQLAPKFQSPLFVCLFCFCCCCCCLGGGGGSGVGVRSLLETPRPSRLFLGALFFFFFFFGGGGFAFREWPTLL